MAVLIFIGFMLAVGWLCHQSLREPAFDLFGLTERTITSK